MLAAQVLAAETRPTRDLGEALAEALGRERKLLEDLAGVLERQRQAVERDDLAGVDESVFAAQRVFRTLGEARRYRRSLLELASGAGDVPLGDFDRALGPLMTLRLGRARDELKQTAQRLEGQLSRNRHLLEAALDSGDRLIRALSGAPPAAAVYAPPGQVVLTSGAALLNRQV
ncbi:MAG TPA: flagellar export chaperone FlgN [Longimicrobiales bacterium]|nr:flagellar export chaperone FlgN [Longimicrobiales bacterium]